MGVVGMMGVMGLMGMMGMMGMMGSCQNYGPFLGTLNIRGRIIIGTQKGTIILTTSQRSPSFFTVPSCQRASRVTLEPCSSADFKES